ncbi:MAG: ABC transporter permease [Eubacterium sp.]|nr:ABC transporter permease [Eubacterium sp.]
MVKKIEGFISRFYLVLIMLFLYMPIFVLIVLSFNDSRSRVTWGGFTFDWYIRLFSNKQIMEALGVTIVLALSSALIATLIGTFGALGIHAMRRKNFQVMMVFTNIPLVNADIVTGIALMLVFVHVIPLGFGSVLLAHITFNIPYVILSVMPKIKQMNISIYEAARDLGANAAYSFVKIVLPQLASGIAAGFLMAFTMSMDDFVITYFTKGAGVNTLSTMIYGEIRKGIKPEMYALSTIIFVAVFLILCLINFTPKKKTAEYKINSRI